MSNANFSIWLITSIHYLAWKFAAMSLRECDKKIIIKDASLFEPLKLNESAWNLEYMKKIRINI